MARSEDKDAGPHSGDQAPPVTRERAFISKLAQRRATLGLSQAEVARRMQTSQSAVARLESSQRDVQLSTVIRYAEALGVSLNLEEPTVEVKPHGAANPGEILPEKPAPRPNELRANQPTLTVGALAGPADTPDPSHVLTGRQRKVLQVIRDSVQQRGYPPSMREIASAVGLTSTSSVAHQLATLERKGYLRRDVGRARTVEIRLPIHAATRQEQEDSEDVSQETTHVPLVGLIAAGVPIIADQQLEELFPLPRQLVGDGSLFMLKVAGDSMIDAGIMDGDLVVVRQQEAAQHGDIVAALISGEATVKTLKRSDGHVWLMPHNPAFTPILGDDAVLLGRVVAVLRRL